MRKRRSFTLLLGFLSLFLLSGCVQLVQEMTVNEDGSGSIYFAIGVETDYYEEFQEDIPEGYALEDLFSSMSQEEYVIETVQDHYEEDGWTWDSIQLDVTDFTAIFAEEDLEIGPVTVELEETEEGYSYYQTVDMADTTLTIAGINLMDLSETSYTIRLNATHITNTDGIQEAVGSCVWEVTLSEVLQEEDDVSMYADYVLTPYEGIFIPWDTFFSELMTGYLVLGIIIILVVIIINTTGKRNPYHR